MAVASRVAGCAAVLVVVAGCGSSATEDAADRGTYVIWRGTTYVMSCQATPDTLLGPAVNGVRFDFTDDSDKAADYTVHTIRGVDPDQVLGLRGPTSKCASEPEPGKFIAFTGDGRRAEALVEAAVEAADPH